MRFVEIGHLALPLLVFVLWRVMASASEPPKILVLGLAAGMLAIGALLVALSYEDAEPPNGAYVPARLENGHVIPGHVDHDAPPPSPPGQSPGPR